MGRDKALLPFRGMTLAQAVAGAALEAAGAVTLVGDVDRYASLGFPVTPDLFPGEGPLGGILTALRHSQAEWNLVVACDMPEAGSALFARLLDAARNSGADALIPVTPDGRNQPLSAVYGSRCLEAFDAAFARGTRAIMAACAEIRVKRLAVEELSSFQNVNTPEEWDAFAAR
jgi:molybdopterin-guanine dinucleotide biosynthesis protein A